MLTSILAPAALLYFLSLILQKWRNHGLQKDRDFKKVDGNVAFLAGFGNKERGRNNFHNYASQLQAIFARFQSTKILK